MIFFERIYNWEIDFQKNLSRNFSLDVQAKVSTSSKINDPGQ
jgi:hypothetical protein